MFGMTTFVTYDIMVVMYRLIVKKSELSCNRIESFSTHEDMLHQERFSFMHRSRSHAIQGQTGPVFGETSSYATTKRPCPLSFEISLPHSFSWEEMIFDKAFDQHGMKSTKRYVNESPYRKSINS